MGINRASRSRYSQMVVGIAALVSLVFGAGTAGAASFLNNCTSYCHGTPSRDAARKANPHFGSQSSAFLGNHKNHLSAPATTNDCSICHTPVSATNFGHQNNIIEMAAKLKGYSTATGRAKYSKGVFFNQTSIPNLTNATCSNVNCHFEKLTPAWGSAAYNVTTSCNACHGAPPSGTAAAPAGGLAGSHARHDAYYTGTNHCQKCHPSHATFSHATSAGRPLKVQGFLRNPLNALEAGATYSGSGTNYLPSKSASQVFGTCSNVYCHGASMPGGDASGSNRAPVWNSSTYLPATIGAGGAACKICHGFPPLPASGHPSLTTAVPATFGNGTVAIGNSCNCHSNISTSGTTFANIFVNKALHVNGILETPSGAHAFPFSGSLHLSAAGTTPWSSCTSCHTNTTGGTYPVAAGTAPNCTGCHINGLRAPSGTSSCWDCHGASATDGKPNGRTFPNYSGNHTVHTAITGVTCATCHTGGGNGSAAHGSSNRVAATTASVKVAFTGQGTAPLWTLSSKTCSATNCHGQGTPAWGARAGAVVNGFPYSSVQCAKCHSGNLATDVTAAKPFYSTAIPQVTLNTNAKVGAHTSHLTAPDGLTNAFTCANCHGAITLTTATHMNGSTNFTWSSLATKSGALTPAYTASSGTCANVYCHGASMPGGDTTGTNRAPTWNSTSYLPATIGSGGTACKTCHGFPPATASGHPALTTAVPTTFGNGTVAIGTSCNCHANISATGTTYANIFVNKAQHIDGTLQVSGGHAVPYDTHNAAVVAAGGNTACLGCHAMGAATSVYPAAVAGNPPDCMSCHKKAAPLHTGTTAGANCSSCHGTAASTTATSKGLPAGSAFPDNTKGHSRSDHKVACSTCHMLGTSGGTGSGINHGRGSTAGPVRDGKPGVVGPFTTGITPTGGSKGVAPSSVSCNHTTAGGGCGSGEGTKSW